MDESSSLSGSSNNGGLVVIGETVVTLHREISTSKEWETIAYGIPCITTNDTSLTINITSVDNGSTLHKFVFTGSEKYLILDKHFHVIVIPNKSSSTSKNEICFGLSFAHETVADRFYNTAIQLMPISPIKAEKQPLSYSSSLVLSSSQQEMTDFPPRKDGVGSLEEEAGALTLSGKFPKMLEASADNEDEQSLKVLQKNYGKLSEDGGLEDVDANSKLKKNHKGSSSKKQWMSASGGPSSDRLQLTRKNLSRRSGSMEEIRISRPVSVLHLAHVNSYTPLHALKQAVNTGRSAFTISDRKHEKLHRTPSAPISRLRRHFSTSNVKPAIIVTPPGIEPQHHHLQLSDLPYPPPPTQDFEELLKEILIKKKDNEDLTCSLDAWQSSFQMAVGNLIHRKLRDDELYSKLLNLTQSGQAESNEKSNNRTGSMIIHDHGVVCL